MMKEIVVTCDVQRTSPCTKTQHSLCRDFIILVAAIDRYVRMLDFSDLHVASFRAGSRAKHWQPRTWTRTD